MKSFFSFALILSAVALAACSTVPVVAQDEKSDDKKPPASIKVEPAKLEMTVGQSSTLKATVLDADGNPVDAAVTFFSSSRRSLTVDQEGKVTAVRPGNYAVNVMTPRVADQERIRVSVEVSVAFPALEKIGFTGSRATYFAGTSVPFGTTVTDVSGAEREVEVTMTSSDPNVVSVDENGYLTAHKPGNFTLTAKVEGIKATYSSKVVALPVQQIVLKAPRNEARTGDVLRFDAQAVDKDGTSVADAPIEFSFYQARSGAQLSTGGTGQIEQDGRFVAEQPGLYTVMATCGGNAARVTVKITPRNIEKRLQVVGQGKVFDTHTSDLWVWEGVDGRDYAVTGTWGANGEAHFWDVTDPSKIERISTVKVDARTVNDVKISEDGKICIISREGASNRRNGIVIYDVTNPADPQLLSNFDDGLTGGVHNLFIHKNHVYAINNGRRYDIINIEDPTQPRRVGGFELETPGHSVHDVWVVDGIAYSSNWGNGLYVVDVGNGVAGGSPEKPVVIDHYTYPNGANHAAFPYYSHETGIRYVVGGDERFPNGLSRTGKPTIAGGYVHFVDFTTPKQPVEVARYELPETGSHNFWIDGDVLYTSMYNGGLRVVDISGELMGDLSRQGREIAHFVPYEPEGFIANAAMVWGPQLHKGHIFFSDWNSGLWAVKLVDKTGRRRGLIRSGGQ